jgi:hypothetical protein
VTQGCEARQDRQERADTAAEAAVAGRHVVPHQVEQRGGITQGEVRARWRGARWRILAEQLLQVGPAELLRPRGQADVPRADEQDGERVLGGPGGRDLQLTPLPIS